MSQTDIKLVLTENEINNLKFLLNDKNFIHLHNILVYNNVQLNEHSIVQCEKRLNDLNDRTDDLNDRTDDIQLFCQNKVFYNGLLFSYMLGTLTGLTSVCLIPIFQYFKK
jgi:hypothetical protein